mgnify:CR=1 FL=1
MVAWVDFIWRRWRKSDQWEVLYICDTDPEARDLARRKSPTSRIVADEQVVFEDPEVQVGRFIYIGGFPVEAN